MAKPTKNSSAAPRINIGISDKDRAAITGELSKLLADSYTLYLMTHNFHWNVTGPLFNTLHNMFMAQYTEEWNALDSIAERIRALGHYAPGTYREYAKLSSIAEPDSVPDALEMVRMLVKGNEAVAKTARAAFDKADAANDQPSAHAAAGRAREERLDAAQPAAVTRGAQKKSRHREMPAFFLPGACPRMGTGTRKLHACPRMGDERAEPGLRRARFAGSAPGCGGFRSNCRCAGSALQARCWRRGPAGWPR